MKYYFAHDVHGRLVAVEMCGNTGWPDSCDLECDQPQDSVAKEVRALRMRSNPDVVGFAPWNCGCESVEHYRNNVNPACNFMHSHVYNINAKVFLPKPDISLHINDEVKMVFKHGSLTSTPTFDYAPLSKLKLRLSGNVPSNTIASIDNTASTVVALKIGKAELTFINSYTEEVDITVPLHGMGSIFIVEGPLVSTGKFVIRGWQD